MTLLLILAGTIGLVVLFAAAGLAFTHPRQTFAILLLLLPFHTLVFQVARVELGLSPTVALLLQSWKEGVILILIAWVLVRMLATLKLRGVYFGMILLVGVFIFVGLLAIRNSPNISAGLYSFRGTYEPFIILLLALLLPLDRQWLKRLIPWMLVSGALVALFAIYQSLFLGFPFLWKYYAQDGIIPTSFVFMGGTIQRAMGTFSSPNQLSLYLSILIIFAVNLFLRLPKPYRKAIFLIGLLSIALLLTVSRSGWAALAIGLGVSILIYRRKQRIIPHLVLLTILVIIVGFATGLDAWAARTLSGNEISANYHVDIFSSNVQTILSHPLGVGLGRVGARSFRFRDANSSNEDFFATESYLLQTGMEVGLPGLLLLLLIMLLSGMILYTNIYLLEDRWSRALVVGALAALAGAFVHALLIPDLQDMAVASYLWFLVGMGMRMPSLERQDSASFVHHLSETQGVV